MTKKMVTVDDTGHFPARVETRLTADFAAKVHTHTASQISDFVEAAEDAVAAMLGRSTNVGISWVYTDNGAGLGTLAATVSSTGGLDAETARDTVNAQFIGTGGVNIAVNDAADTVTFSISGVTISQVTGLQTNLDTLQSNIDGKEPSRTAVTQAEAEAGTATTVRGWTALRVAQAVAAYIANNVASIKSVLGIAPVSYLWSSSGVATVAATGSHRVPVNQTLTQARMRTGTAPAGSALTAVVQRSTAGGAFTDLVTLSIAAGSTTEDVEPVTTAITAGDLLRLNVTSVGSTTAATGVVVEVYPA